VDPVLLAPGYGFRVPTVAELRDRSSVLDLCALFERPRRRGPRRYVIGVDVADGMGGGDRSAIEVVRVPTIEEPAEQVAEYLTDLVEPGPLAYIVQALGEYYTDEDGHEAKVAIERTHHGLSTIDTLHNHLGYTNQYIWEYFDAADPSTRFSTVFGWQTTPRTRPVLVDKFRTAVMTVDPITGQPDLVINSRFTLDEMRDFQTEGALWEAAAARGAHDDSVMGVAIAYIVSWRLQAGETEPLDERRRRKHEQEAMLREQTGQPVKLDYRNTAATADDQKQAVGRDEEVPLDEQLADLSQMDRASEYGRGDEIDWFFGGE